MPETNPNGANQFVLDPRQKLCWESYINPRSETFGNAYRSAVLAGYEDETAKHITLQNWFLEKLRRLNLLSKGEKVLEETLDYVVLNEEGKVDASIGRLKLDAAKHVTSTLGKDIGYSTKTETDITTLGQSVNEPMTPAVLAAAKAYEDAMKKALLE